MLPLLYCIWLSSGPELTLKPEPADNKGSSTSWVSVALPIHLFLAAPALETHSQCGSVEAQQLEHHKGHKNTSPFEMASDSLFDAASLLWVNGISEIHFLLLPSALHQQCWKSCCLIPHGSSMTWKNTMKLPRHSFSKLKKSFFIFATTCWISYFSVCWGLFCWLAHVCPPSLYPGILQLVSLQVFHVFQR